MVILGILLLRVPISATMMARTRPDSSLPAANREILWSPTAKIRSVGARPLVTVATTLTNQLPPRNTWETTKKPGINESRRSEIASREN